MAIMSSDFNDMEMLLNGVPVVLRNIEFTKDVSGGFGYPETRGRADFVVMNDSVFIGPKNVGHGNTCQVCEEPMNSYEALCSACLLVVRYTREEHMLNAIREVRDGS